MKKQILFIVTALILAVCSIAVAGEKEGLFSQGNRAYVEGDYQKALSCYQQVMEQEGISSSLLYNMANAYYHTRDIGNAVLYYERALYLDPDNLDIQKNLAMTRKDFGLMEKNTDGWEHYFHFLNLNGWTWLASASLTVFCLIFLLRGLYRKPGRNRVLRVLSVAALCLSLVSGIGVLSQYEWMDRGIVTAKDASLLVSPFDTASKSSAIKDGRMVRIAKRYKDYLLVKESTGESGWIARKDVKSVIPGGDLG